MSPLRRRRTEKAPDTTAGTGIYSLKSTDIIQDDLGTEFSSIIDNLEDVVERGNDIINGENDPGADTEYESDPETVESVSKWRLRGAVALGLPGAIAKKLAANTVGRLKMFNRNSGRLSELTGKLGESGRYNSRVRRHEDESDAEYRDRMKKNGKVTIALGAAAIGGAASIALAATGAGATTLLAAKVAKNVAVGTTAAHLKDKLSTPEEQRTRGEKFKDTAKMIGFSALGGFAASEMTGSGIFNKGGTSWLEHTKNWWHGGAKIGTESHSVSLAAARKTLTINGHGGGRDPSFNNMVQRSDSYSGSKAVLTDNDMSEVFAGEKNTMAQSAEITSGQIAEAALGNPDATIIGYSQGSVAAMKFLVDNPTYEGKVVLVGTPFGVEGVEGREGLGKESIMQALKGSNLDSTHSILQSKGPRGENVTMIIRKHDLAGGLGTNPARLTAGLLDPNMHAYIPDDLDGTTPRVTVRGKNGETLHVLTNTLTNKPGTSTPYTSGIAAGIQERTGTNVSGIDRTLTQVEGDPITGKIDGKKTLEAVAQDANTAAPGAGEVIKQVVAPEVADNIANVANNSFDQIDTLVRSVAETPLAKEAVNTLQPPVSRVIGDASAGKLSPDTARKAFDSLARGGRR